jgi:hypothetical protein
VEKRIYVIRHGEKSFDPYNENAYKVGCLSQMGWGRAYNLVSLFGPNPRSDLHKADYVYAAQYRPINCRDEHGWYRTHQTVSAVAQAVNKGKACLYDKDRCVDTSTSMNGDNSLFLKIAEHVKGVHHDDEEWDKQYCDVKVGTPACIPYNAAGHILKPGRKVTDILWETGTCCNGAAAETMKKKLAEMDGTTILVGWEHVNIQWLAEALAAPHIIQHRVDDYASCDSPPCPDGDDGKAWPDDNYDMIYKFTYDCGPSGCTAKHNLDDAVSLTDLSQEFIWLGPTVGCGFTNTTGDISNFGDDKETVEYGPDFTCIGANNCPAGCDAPPSDIGCKGNSAATIMDLCPQPKP